MTSDVVAALALAVTALGWLVTYLSQREQAKTTANIQRVLLEHETRFSHVHKRRADAIDALYKAQDRILRLLYASMRGARFGGEATPEEMRNEALQRLFALQEEFYQNRLYLDEELCVPFEQLLKRLLGVFSTIGTAAQLRETFQAVGPYFPLPDVIASHSKLMEEAAEIVLREMPPMQNRIENHMRDVLGRFTSRTESLASARGRV